MKLWLQERSLLRFFIVHRIKSLNPHRHEFSDASFSRHNHQTLIPEFLSAAAAWTHPNFELRLTTADCVLHTFALIDDFAQTIPAFLSLFPANAIFMQRCIQNKSSLCII